VNEPEQQEDQDDTRQGIDDRDGKEHGRSPQDKGLPFFILKHETDERPAENRT